MHNTAESGFFFSFDPRGLSHPGGHQFLNKCNSHRNHVYAPVAARCKYIMYFSCYIYGLGIVVIVIIVVVIVITIIIIIAMAGIQYIIVECYIAPLWSGKYPILLYYGGQVGKRSFSGNTYCYYDTYVIIYKMRTGCIQSSSYNNDNIVPQGNKTYVNTQRGL